MGSLLYLQGLRRLLDGTWAWPSSAFKAMLVSDAYQPDNEHEYASSVAAYELSGTGYAGGYGGAGRKTLASKTLTVSAAKDRILFGAADLTWTALDAGTVGGMVLLVEAGGSNATSPLLAFLELADYPTHGSDYVVVWPDSGTFFISA